MLQQPERLQYKAETYIVVDQIHFTSVRFHRFKSFWEYSVQLREFNIREYPQLRDEDITAALMYASESVHQESIYELGA